MPSQKQLDHYAKMRAAKAAKHQQKLASQPAKPKKAPTAKQQAYWGSLRTKTKTPTEKQLAYWNRTKPEILETIQAAPQPIVQPVVAPPKKKPNEGLAKARKARMENLERTKVQRETKKAAAQLIKEVKREQREAARERKRIASRKKVGDEFTFKDVIEGRLPDQYPYFVQVEAQKDRRRPKAKLIKSDDDVKRLLKSLETKDSRAKIVDIKKPKMITKKKPTRETIREAIQPVSFADNIADDDDIQAFMDQVAGEPAYEYSYAEPDYDEVPVDAGYTRETFARDYDNKYDNYDYDYIDIDSPINGGSGGCTYSGGGGGCGAVAKSLAENCLINIIRMKDRDVNVVYERFPHLRPNNLKEPIYITHDEIAEVSKLLKTNIIVYTSLGAKINKPWHEFKYNNNSCIRVIFENGHAFVMQKKCEISNIIYKSFDDITDIEGLVVDHAYYQDPPESIATLHKSGGVPMYYTVLYKGKYTMYKDYKPSSLTGNANDDLLTSGNTYIFSNSQYLFKRFKKRYDMKVIKQDDMREIVKSAEHFIGRELYEKTTPDTKVIDQNKNYCAYKSCGYYIGFPGNEFAASANPQPAGSPYTDVYVAVKDIKGLPWFAERLFKYTNGSIVLPIPVYNCLLKLGITCEVLYWVASTIRDIDIVKYADDSGIPEQEKKNFRNALIGRSISGGMKDERGMLIRTANEREFDQILYECRENNVPVTINDDKSLIVRYKSKPSAIYQFHSYILGYAAIHLLTKMKELEDNGCRIVGYNVDSIFYNGNYDANEGCLNEIGGWKYEPIHTKTLLKSMKTIERTPFNELKVRQPDHLEAFRYLKNTIIVGPPGIGKSHEFKTKVLFNQILTTPTRFLREEHKAGEFGFENTFTIHKYVQFNQPDDLVKARRRRGEIPAIHYTLIIDEYTMLTKQQFDLIMKRVVSNKIRVIVLGDQEQISNNISGDKLTIEYMIKTYGFDIKRIERAPDMKARHSYNEGCILDTLRGLEEVEEGKGSYKRAKARNDEQVKRLRPYVKSIKDIYSQIPNMITNESNDIYVADTHKKLNLVNAAARKHCQDKNLLFPVNDGKGNVIRVSPDHPLIWWDRRRMLDVRPDDLKYEPVFAVTGDSIQGRTLDCRVYVDTTMVRPKVFYTAVTRTRVLSNIILVDSSPVKMPPKKCGSRHEQPEQIPDELKTPAEDMDCMHESPEEIAVHIANWEPVFSTGPKCIYPMPENKIKWTVQDRMKLLKKKIYYITKTFRKTYLNPKDAKEIKTFAEDECYTKLTKAIGVLANEMKKKPLIYKNANEVGKVIRERFSKLYKEISAANINSKHATPTNMLVYKELYRLAKKCHKKKEYELAMLYRSNTVYDLMLYTYEELRKIDPDTLKSVEHAKAIWKELNVTNTSPFDEFEI